MNTSPVTPKISFQEYASFLRRYLRGRLPLVLALGVTLLVNIALQIINPQIMRSFIDNAMAGQALSMLTTLALVFIGIAVFQQLIGVLVTYITENLGWAATNDVRADLARHCLGLDMSFHTAHTPGEMIERIDGDVMALSNFFSQFILQVFGNLLLVIGVMVVLIWTDWRVSLALSVFIAVTMIVLLRLSDIAVPSWEAERQASANLYGFLEERLSGTEDIRALNARDYVLDRFYRLVRDLMKKTISAGIKVNILLNTTWLLFAVGTAVAILVSAALYKTGTITLGSVFMIIYYINMLNWPLERITQQMQDLQKAGASLTRILSIQQIKGKIPGEEQFMPAEPALASRAGDSPGPLEVVFRNVTFGYSDSQATTPVKPTPVRFSELPVGAQVIPSKNPDSQNAPEAVRAAMAASLAVGSVPIISAWSIPELEEERALEKEIVLREVSFHLKPGRTLGLLGRTGSGKTTLTRLLFRLYDPDEGVIQIGAGTDIRQMPVQELRRQVGMVTQNIQLFHATVRENLTFFDTTIPDERILQAIDDLGLSAWFKSLPKGLDTELESGGGGLSAGEAQLLAFTRIFLRNPGLIILDEATSRLDPATEHLIELAVDKLVHQRSAIIVAHRLGTVQRADDILILENGQTIEYGERLQLASDPDSRFYQLLQTGLEEVLA